MLGASLCFIEEIIKKSQHKSKYENSAQPKFRSLLQNFCIVWASNFGLNLATLTQKVKMNFASERLLLVASFLSGNVIFSGYRASLTSELSVQEVEMPFSTIEEMVSTNYV